MELLLGIFSRYKYRKTETPGAIIRENFWKWTHPTHPPGNVFNISQPRDWPEEYPRLTTKNVYVRASREKDMTIFCCNKEGQTSPAGILHFFPQAMKRKFAEEPQMKLKYDICDIKKGKIQFNASPFHTGQYKSNVFMLSLSSINFTFVIILRFHITYYSWYCLLHFVCSAEVGKCWIFSAL